MTAALSYHAQIASADALIARLEGVQAAGRGHRALCPACGGRSRKLSVTEAEDRVLVHCFGGCQAVEVLQAVGLTWADIMPPRHWPDSPQEQRQLRRAAREGALIAALPELAYAAAVVHIAAKQLHRAGQFTEEDLQTVIEAEETIGSAREFFCENRKGVTHA